MIDRNQTDLIIWQEVEEGVPELPIAVKFWSGGPSFELRQGKNSISLNLEIIPDLIHVLKKLQRTAGE